jgi:hypothetical protein
LVLENGFKEQAMFTLSNSTNFFASDLHFEVLRIKSKHWYFKMKCQGKCWFWSSGLWHYAFLWVVTSILVEPIASIFRVEGIQHHNPEADNSNFWCLKTPRLGEMMEWRKLHDEVYLYSIPWVINLQSAGQVRPMNPLAVMKCLIEMMHSSEQDMSSCRCVLS